MKDKIKRLSKLIDLKAELRNTEQDYKTYNKSIKKDPDLKGIVGSSAYFSKKKRELKDQIKTIEKTLR